METQLNFQALVQSDGAFVVSGTFHPDPMTEALTDPPISQRLELSRVPAVQDRCI